MSTRQFLMALCLYEAAGLLGVWPTVSQHADRLPLWLVFALWLTASLWLGDHWLGHRL